MKVIRKSVFETNSSSTHSICISNIDVTVIPKVIDFTEGEFGWEWDRLTESYEKASYLYTAIRKCYLGKDLKGILYRLDEILKRYGVEKIRFNKEYKGYIDHDYELKGFVKEIISDEKKLINFLFSDRSFIQTGNDNIRKFEEPMVKGIDKELKALKKEGFYVYTKGN